MINLKKILIVVLALLSFLLLSAGWTKIRSDEQIDASEVEDWVENELDYYVNQLERYVGIEIETSNIKKLVKIISDGKLSPSELNKTATIANSEIPKINKQLKKLSDNSLSMYLGSDALEEFTDTTSKYNRYATMYRIIYFITIVSFLYFVFATVMDKKGRFIYPIMLFAIFIIFAFLSSREIDGEKILSMTLAPFVSLVFAIGSLVVEKLPLPSMEQPMFSFAGNTNLSTINLGGVGEAAKNIGASVLDKTKNLDLGGTWQCPYCGQKNSKSSKFCSTCGRPNPNVVTCPTCGLELKNHEKFCPQCGTTINWPETEKTCPNCGHKNKLNVNFCENCGTPLNNTNQA